MKKANAAGLLLILAAIVTLFAVAGPTLATDVTRSDVTSDGARVLDSATKEYFSYGGSAQPGDPARLALHYTEVVDENSPSPWYDGPFYIPTDPQFHDTAGFSDLTPDPSWDYKWYNWFNQDWGWKHTFPYWTSRCLTLESANLTIRAWDIDWGAGAGAEHDSVYVDGIAVGELRGAARLWSETIFDVPFSAILDDGQIDVWLNIDATHNDYTWATTIDWSELNIEYSLVDPRLEIVENLLSDGFDPPNPWDQPGLVELRFNVVALCKDLTHVRFFSDPLQHESRPKKIPGSCIEFIPQEIGFLAEGDTAEVIAKVQIPIGQLWGRYIGYFRTVCCEGLSDSVRVSMMVWRLADLDIDDDHGNLSANTMELEGVSGSTVQGAYILVNPNMWESNVDLYDGPGNCDLFSLSYSWTDLISYGALDTIPAANVNPNVRGINSLPHSDAAENLVEVIIPPGMPINTTYRGTVSVKGWPPPPETDQDYFTLEVTVVPTSGGAPVVVEGDSLPTVFFTPPDPWVQEGLRTLTFRVTSAGDLIHVYFSSDDLMHDAREKKLPGNQINFIPQEIGHLGPADTVAVTAHVQIPIGQHEGLYEGHFRVVACNGQSDAVLARVRVNPLADLDIQDYAGDLSANRMRLIGPSGSIVAGTFNEVSPNMWENNFDPFDGPGNVDLTGIDYVVSDLYCRQGHIIPAGQVSLPGPCALGSGEAHQHIVAVNLADIHPNEKDYTGQVFARVNADTEDVFTLTVNVDASGQLCTNGFKGEPCEDGNLLEWVFSLNQQGFNLYRSEPGNASFTRLNSSLMNRTTYMDGDILGGLPYEYKLGLVFGDGSEILLGPLSVTALKGMSYALFQNSPNPMREGTEICYAVASPAKVSLRVYNAAGRAVRTLVDEWVGPGYHAVEWDGTDEDSRAVSTGVYFYRLSATKHGGSASGGAAEDFSRTRKAIVLR